MKSTAGNVIPNELKLEIENLYQDMIGQYFSSRARKYLAPNHKEDFVNGIWRSIQQMKKEGFTREVVDHGKDSRGKDSRLSDLANDIISANVLFFLTDFNGEEQAIAETQYYDFVKSHL